MKINLMLLVFLASVGTFLAGYNRVLEEDPFDTHDFRVDQCFYTDTLSRYCLNGELVIHRNSYDATLAVDDIPIKSVTGKFLFSPIKSSPLRMSEESLMIFNHNSLTEVTDAIPAPLLMKLARKNSIAKKIEMLQTSDRNLVWLVDGRLVYMQRRNL